MSNLHYDFQKEVIALHSIHNTSMLHLHSRVNLKKDLPPVRDKPHQRLSTIELLNNPTNYYIYMHVIYNYLQFNLLFF